MVEKESRIKRHSEALEKVGARAGKFVGKAYEHINSHIKEYALGVAGAGLVLAGGIYLAGNNSVGKDGELVYDGTLQVVRMEKEHFAKDMLRPLVRNVEYREGVNGDDNVLIVGTRRGNDRINFELYDTEGATSINWQASKNPDFESDKLERIIIELDDKRVELTREDRKRDDLTGDRARRIFERADKYYSAFRQGVRDKLQGEYEEETQDILNELEEVVVSE